MHTSSATTSKQSSPVLTTLYLLHHTHSAMEEADQRELQLLPTRLSSRMTGTSRRPRSMADFDGQPLDLQLSISLRPIRPPPPPQTRPDYVLPKSLPEQSNMKIDFSSIEVLKWQTAEQIRLAAVEKAYAERVKELTRREMELAQSEFARARQMWERARQEVEKAERLKERAARHIDSTCMEITCQVCRQRFRP